MLTELARTWLKDFTASFQPGMYAQDEVTPYIHILVDHCPKLAEIHGPLDIFACDGLEKKGHLFQMFFWRRTMKGGGIARQSPILLWMQRENRDIHFLKEGKLKLNDLDEIEEGEKSDSEDEEEEEVVPGKRRKTYRHLARRTKRKI